MWLFLSTHVLCFVRLESAITFIENDRVTLTSKFKRKHLKFDDIEPYIYHSTMTRTSGRFQMTLAQSCNNIMNIWESCF